MQRLLIIGKSFSGLTTYLKEHGYDYIVLKDALEAKHPEKKLKRRILCDFSSKEQIIKAVDAITRPIDGVLVVYENYVLPTAWIAKHLGLPGMPAEAAEACTDKWLMRQRFATAPEKISPDFAIVKNEDQLRDFANTHSFPLMLKPANLAKSLLITKNHDLQELLANYAKTMSQIDGIYKKYAPNRQPKLLIEEFLQGSVHSVDAFVDQHGEPKILEQIADYQMGYHIGFEDNFCYSRLMPSALSYEDQQALRRCAALGVKALGMLSSPAHIEIIMTNDGPRVVEIGARNGGYRERMYALANGIDITSNALKLTLGEAPDIQASKNDPVGVFELYPKQPGIFESITNEAALKALPSLTYYAVKTKPGYNVGKAADGHKACAIIILHNSDSKQFASDVSFVNDNVAVVTRPVEGA